MFSRKTPLVIAGIFSAIGALLHLATIIGGPDWYRFMGAGEGMAQMAEDGLAYPSIVTSVIALILFIWSAYAFSGAGIIKRLPLLKTGLVLISAVLMIRALFGIVIVTYIEHPYLNELQTRPTFMLITSLICLVFSMFYILGTYKQWQCLSVKSKSKLLTNDM